jgi:imidazoleglycerol-phosphate dehydratase
MTRVKRTTKETRIAIDLDPAGGTISVDVPDAFFGHMVATIARYAGWGLSLKADSRDGIDHHVIEDVAITLGRAVRQLAEDGGPVARYGHAVVAMDEALVETVLDVGGRAYYDGELPMPMMEHAARSLAFEAGATLHIDVRRGRDAHHVVEAAFKGLGMALRTAMAPADEVASTKGEVAYGR